MDSLHFCYWLQGYMELAGNKELMNLDYEQIKIIKDHLQLVFNKVTPSRFNENNVCTSVTIPVNPYQLPYRSSNVPAGCGV